jgi:alcohol dehydrogenase, propanol-preferring
MKAFRLLQAGESGSLQSVKRPRPAPGQILIKIAGAGLCHSDLHFQQPAFPRVPFLTEKTPFTLGHENAGWIEETGAGVTGLDAGAAVIVHSAIGCHRCRLCQAGEEQICEQTARRGPSYGLGVDGGLAEYMLVDSPRQLIPLGDLDPREAAPLTDAALTPYRPIRRSLGQLRAGTHAVVIGVGGLGHMAVQILRVLSPVQVVAVDRSPDKLALAKSVGADKIVVSDDQARTALREAVGGRRAALVLDFVGTESTLALAASIVELGGRIVVLGVANGTLPWKFSGMPLESSLTTSYWGNLTELREVVALAQEGRIRVRTQRFTLEQTAEAYHKLERGEIEGRAVVTPHG